MSLHGAHGRGEAQAAADEPARIERLSVTPVKGTRLLHPQTVALESGGVREDRLFYVVDGRGRMVNGKQLGGLSSVCADYDAQSRRLRLSFPELGEVSEEVRLGEALATRFYSSRACARVVLGPFSDALSRHLGHDLRLVQAEGEGRAIDRGGAGGVSILSGASVARLAREAGEDSIDARRFRMSIEISGVAAHEEDSWVGRRVALGGAVVAIRGHVGRCLVTSRDPDTGEVDLPTLELLGSYRKGLATTEPLALGVFGKVLQPAAIRVGDSVAPI